MPSLDGPLLKLDRALQQIQALNAEINHFRSRLKANPDPVRVEFDQESLEHVVILNVNEEPPAEWSTWVGEIIHDLRSALDHFVWQLASITAGDPDPSGPLPGWRGNLSFPVIYDPKKGGRFPRDLKEFTSKQSSGNLHNVPPTAISRIFDAQPYVIDPGSPPESRLARLAQLSNIDKHQTLHVVGNFSVPSPEPLVTFAPHNVEITSQWVCPHGPIKPEQVLARLTIRSTGENPHVRVESHFSPDVALQDPSPLTGWDDHLAGALTYLWTGVQGILLGSQDILPPTAGIRPISGVIVDRRLMIEHPQHVQYRFV